MPGVLPFDRDGELRDRSGDLELLDLPIGVWKINQSTSNVGESYEYMAVIRAQGAEAKQELAAALLGQQNRRLTVEPPLGPHAVFNVVEATEHWALGYVELALTVSAPNG